MLCTLGELYELTGFSRAHIRELIRGRVTTETVNRRVKYESLEALPLIYGDRGERFVLAEEKARLAFHQANHAALKEAQARGRLLPADLVEELLSALVTAARSRVLGIHNKIRSRHPTLEQEIADEIEHLAFEALKELADDDLPAELQARVAQYSESVVSAPSVTRERVG